MDKHQFIMKLVECFPSSFKDRSKESIFEEYDIGLADNLDFDKLYLAFVQNYDKANAPRPAYFKQFYEQCMSNVVSILTKLPAYKRKALIKVANWVNSPEYEDCLYNKRKAPYEIRELVRKYNFSAEEIDQARISGQLGEDEGENDNGFEGKN